MAIVDLIIPVYNNNRGLFRSLMSIGTETDVNVIIVDDCSNENYDNIIEMFSNVLSIQMFKLDKNGGPGVARQFGLNKCSSKYVVFLDAGDVFYSPISLNYMVQQLENDNNIYVGSFAHSDQKSPVYLDYVGPDHNRIHGKIYRRSFLKKYNITFCTESSYCNEDIGFNFCCRTICDDLFEKTNISHMVNYEDTMVIWTNYDESIVRANDCGFYYKEQNEGLSKNALHCIKLCKKNRVHNYILEDFSYDIMCNLYFFYMNTTVVRKEYEDIAFNGAYIFYKEHFRNYVLNEELLTVWYYRTLQNFIMNGDPITLKVNKYNIYNFLDDLESKYNEEKENEND